MKNPAPDLRVDRTIHKLEAALFLLIQQSTVNEITVKRLCEQAGIHRSTFYDYFHSVSDLLEYLIDRHIQVLKKGVQKYFLHSTNIHDYYHWLLTYIKEHQCVFYCLYAFESRTDFMKKCDFFTIQQNSNPQMDEYVPISPTDPLFLRTFSQYGAHSVIKRWLMGGCQQPISEVAELLSSYLCRLFQIEEPKK